MIIWTLIYIPSQRHFTNDMKVLRELSSLFSLSRIFPCEPLFLPSDRRGGSSSLLLPCPFLSFSLFVCNLEARCTVYPRPPPCFPQPLIHLLITPFDARALHTPPFVLVHSFEAPLFPHAWISIVSTLVLFLEASRSGCRSSFGVPYAFITGYLSCWTSRWCSALAARIELLLVLSPLLRFPSLHVVAARVATSNSDFGLPLQIAIYDGPFLGWCAKIQLGWANLLAHSQYSLGLCWTMLVVLGSLLDCPTHSPYFSFDVSPLYCLETKKKKKKKC